MKVQHYCKIWILSSLASVCITAQGTRVYTYVGGAAGHSSSDYNATNQGVAPATTSESGFAYRIQGGYQFNVNFATEFGYNRYRTVDFTNMTGISGATGKAELRSVDAVGKFIFPISSLADLFAKAGFAYVEVDGRNSPSTTSVNVASADTFRPIYGLGGSSENVL